MHLYTYHTKQLKADGNIQLQEFLPYLMVGLTTNPQHFFALQLQLPGQSIDSLVKRVDFMVQLSDAVATGAQLPLKVRNANQEFLFLKMSRWITLTWGKIPFTKVRTERFTHHSYLLVTVLHCLLHFPFSGTVFFVVDLLQMLDGRSVEVVQFCSKRRCQPKPRNIKLGIKWSKNRCFKRS